ncbi:dual specificity protein kinase shkA-like [Oscarella lobularis]|uniref:dual specificity protein kinase shkA-like n=1 Tax=Oscarella lobularis TaxID=121494 RepID=UPI00331315E2
MQVAIKILNENERLFVNNSNELFQQEIDFMRHLRHPNIVLFLGAGSFQTDRNLFLVTEFVSRGSLHGVLTDGSTSLTVDQNIGFCLDSANGMRFLHELNPPRIHRDLKAANLLVSQNWVVKVSDFGTARRLLKSSKDELNQGEISAGDQFPVSDDETQPLLLARYKNMSWRHGTSLWKAPELLMQQAYGASVDIYSFGIVMWEIFSRRKPYDDRRLPQHLNSLVELICEKGMRPTVTSSEWPREIIELMRMCWQREPTLRPTFRNICKRLETLQNSQY